jgi:hypothetical protein
MKNNIKKDSKYIEQWALLKIIDNYDIENSISTGDSISIEIVIRDLSVTYPMSIFRTLPNYARLLVIKALEWHEVLSMDNIHYVESELRNEEEAYENYDWYIADTAREVKQNLRSLNV